MTALYPQALCEVSERGGKKSHEVESQPVTHPRMKCVSDEPHKGNVLLSLYFVYSPTLFISVSRFSRMRGVLPVCGLQPLLALLLLQTVGCGESSLNRGQSTSPDLLCVQYMTPHTDVHRQTFDQTLLFVCF